MLENIRLSIKGILSHKMRSILTMLGVIIGIASIIIIVAIIQGTTQSLKDSMVGNDTNTITLNIYSQENLYTPYDTSYRGVIPGVSKIPKSNVKAVEEIDGVDFATPIYYKAYSVSTSYNDKVAESATYGVEKNFFDATDMHLVSGRLFADRDYEENHNVVVLSSKIAGELFSNEDAVGKTVKIANDMFVVVGIVEKNVDYSGINSYWDYMMKFGLTENEVYVPTKVWDLVGGFDDVQSLVVKLDNVDEIVNVSKSAADILNENVSTDQYEYKSNTLSQDAEDIQQVSNIASILLVGIASISLLVGGIGVMNIMLVSVTERTREIGLKKALGAKRRIILLQFLTEAVVLTGMGGIIGVIIGITVAKLIGLIMGITIVISVTVIVISVGFSMFVGIIFGLLPSIKASKLDPIDALRYE